MPKSSLSDKTTRRPKEPFDSTLEDPIALTPDQLETVVGGLVISGKTGGAMTGAHSVLKPPLHPPVKLL
jgi:hypothetical protein